MFGYGESGQLAGGTIQGDQAGELIGESYAVPENIDLKGRCVLHASAGSILFSTFVWLTVQGGQHSVFLIKRKEGE